MRALILFSGGVDSTVMLAMALQNRRECYALSFDYGQRHRVELEAARDITRHYDISHTIIKIDPQAFSQSSLVTNLQVPKNRTIEEMSTSKIPSTYVPARNTLFLAYAAGRAEMLNADEIYFGANANDCNAYPDCRPAYVQSFQRVLDVATKQAIEGRAPQLVTPLISWDKPEIIRQGALLKVPFELTFSCYDPIQGRVRCGECDACILRRSGFQMASLSDV